MPARGSAAAPRAWCEQRVQQRAGPVAGGRMHDQAGRLVEHEERFVLEDDRQRPSPAAR